MRKDHVFVLHNGVEIPEIGFGTWQISNDEAYNSVTMALKNGYTHIDTAYNYKNEENVGKAIREFDIAREDVFVTSKLPASVKDYDGTIDHFNQSLTSLGLEYLDLYLIHWPKPWSGPEKDYGEENVQVWRAMEKLYNEGKIRAIGVSNFSIADLQPILENCEIVPMVNQIPYYIGRDQTALIDFCREHNIVIEAYSPLATGQILNSPEIKEIADRYGRTPAQICIKWCLQKDTLPLPKSSHEERIIENAQMDFEISAEDMKILDAMEDVRADK